MNTYTLTEVQRQQLLEMTAFAYNACEDDWVQDEKITPAISLLDGLTPNIGEVAAPSTSQPFVAHQNPAHHTQAFSIEHLKDVVEHARGISSALDAWIADAQSGFTYKPCPVAYTVAAPSTSHAKYDELIYAVSLIYPGETRHETALRYIKNAEVPSEVGAAKTIKGGA